MSDFWDWASEPDNYVLESSGDTSYTTDWKYDSPSDYVSAAADQGQSGVPVSVAGTGSSGNFFDFVNNIGKTITTVAHEAGVLVGAVNNADNEFKAGAGIPTTTAPAPVQKKLSPIAIALIAVAASFAFRKLLK